MKVIGANGGQTRMSSSKVGLAGDEKSLRVGGVVGWGKISHNKKKRGGKDKVKKKHTPIVTQMGGTSAGRQTGRERGPSTQSHPNPPSFGNYGAESKEMLKKKRRGDPVKKNQKKHKIQQQKKKLAEKTQAI